MHNEIRHLKGGRCQIESKFKKYTKWKYKSRVKLPESHEIQRRTSDGDREELLWSNQHWQNRWQNHYMSNYVICRIMSCYVGNFALQKTSCRPGMITASGTQAALPVASCLTCCHWQWTPMSMHLNLQSSYWTLLMICQNIDLMVNQSLNSPASKRRWVVFESHTSDVDSAESILVDDDADDSDENSTDSNEVHSTQSGISSSGSRWQWCWRSFRIQHEWVAISNSFNFVWHQHWRTGIGTGTRSVWRHSAKMHDSAFGKSVMMVWNSTQNLNQSCRSTLYDAFERDLPESGSITSTSVTEYNLILRARALIKTMKFAPLAVLRTLALCADSGPCGTFLWETSKTTVN